MNFFTRLTMWVFKSVKTKKFHIFSCCRVSLKREAFARSVYDTKRPGEPRLYMTQNVRFMIKRFKFIKLTRPGEPRLSINLFLTGLRFVRSNSDSQWYDFVFHIKWSKTGVSRMTCYEEGLRLKMSTRLTSNFRLLIPDWRSITVSWNLNPSGKSWRWVVGAF